MEVNVIRYRKMRAIIFYSLTSVLMICIIYDFFWFENFPGQFLNWLGVHTNPAPPATRIVLAIMFAAMVLAFEGYTLSLALEAIERHADDERFFKMKRSWASYLIEGREPVKSNWKPDKAALPIATVKSLYDLPGKEAILMKTSS